MTVNDILAQTEECEPCHYRLHVTVLAAMVDKIFAQSEKSFMSHAKFPGFRAGKTPRQLIRNRFQKKIKEETKQTLLREGLQTALEQCALTPITFPNFVDSIKQSFPEKNQNFSFTVEFDVAPKIDLPTDKKVLLKRNRIVLKDEDINQHLQRLAQSRIRYEPVERSCQAEDMVKVSFHAEYTEPKESIPKQITRFLSSEETWLKLGEPEVFPGIIAGLTGRSKGEIVKLHVNFPDNYVESLLSGKTLIYDFKVIDIHACILPELNDAFAVSLGIKDLVSLKTEIKDTIQKQQDKVDFYQQLWDILLKGNDFPLPPTLLASNTQHLLQNQVAQALSKGMSKSELENRMAEFKKKASDEAKIELKKSFITAEIAREERIIVDPEEVDAEWERITKQTGQSQHNLPHQSRQKEIKDYLYQSLLTEKVLTHLLKHADIR